MGSPAAGGNRAAASAVDPVQVVDRFTPFEDMLDSRVATPRFGAWMLGLFPGMALLLAAVGLAASIAWWIAQRTRGSAFAWRLARTRASRPSRRPAGTDDCPAGSCLAWVRCCPRLLANWLCGVTPLDAATFAWSAAGMLAIAALASYLPARRAATSTRSWPAD